MFGSRFYAPHFAPQQRQKYQRPQPQEPNFQGLFRLIDDWDRYAQQTSSSPCSRQVTTTRTFTPKFDVKETETAYELHGELPGIEKENVHIEFTDPQTIRIRGRVDRSYTAGTPPATLDDNKVVAGAIAHESAEEEEQQQQQHQEQEEEDDGFEAIQADDHSDHHSETSSHKSFQATVEDEDEDGTITTTSSPVPTPPASTTTTATVAPIEEEKKKKKQEVQKPQPVVVQPPQEPKNKFWVSERSVGEFTRLFTFPSRVEAESVVAGLQNGILTVSVPKARKHETRRIVIF